MSGIFPQVWLFAEMVQGGAGDRKSPEITSHGLGHLEDHSSGKGLWELGPQASSLGLAPSSMPQFPSFCLYALTLSTTSFLWVSRLWEAMSWGGGCPPLSLKNVLNLWWRRHGQRSEWASLRKNGHKREGPPRPFRGSYGWTTGRKTCTNHSIERLLREALRNPFPEAPMAAGPTVWNLEEAAEGIPAGWVSGAGDSRERRSWM